MKKAKVINVALGKEPCPKGYEVIQINQKEWQIWQIGGGPYCWVVKEGDEYKIIS